MPSKTTTARLGAKGALVMIRHPTLRRAAAPSAKLGWHTGRLLVTHQARAQAVRLRAAGETAGSVAVVYGPLLAEAFGLVEKPKPKRRAPAFLAGVLIGATATAVLARRQARPSPR